MLEDVIWDHYHCFRADAGQSFGVLFVGEDEQGVGILTFTNPVTRDNQVAQMIEKRDALREQAARRREARRAEVATMA